MKTNKVQPITPEEPTVHELATQAMKEHDGDVTKATAWLVELARRSPPVYHTLTDRLIEPACYAAVSKIGREERAYIWNAPNHDHGGKSDRLHRFASSLLMDFPLPGGMRLRDAKRADLVGASEFFGKQAKDMFDKSKWLALIADKVGRGKVGNQLTESTLVELKASL